MTSLFPPSPSWTHSQVGKLRPETSRLHLCPALAHLRSPIPGQRASFPGIFQVHTHGSGIDLEHKCCKAPDEGYVNWPRLHRPFQRASLASSPRPSSEERAEGTPLPSAQQPKPLVSRSPAPLPTQKPSVATYTHTQVTHQETILAPNLPSCPTTTQGHHYTVITTFTKMTQVHS